MHEEGEDAPVKVEYLPARQGVQDVAPAPSEYEAAAHNAHPASHAVRLEATHDPEKYSCHPEEGASRAVLVMRAKPIVEPQGPSLMIQIPEDAM
jgi:hypothetical protein